MPRGPAGREARVVNDDVRHIAIDVRIDGDEISGEACDGSGRSTPFSGWLGLLGALDVLISAKRANGAPT